MLIKDPDTKDNHFKTEWSSLYIVMIFCSLVFMYTNDKLLLIDMDNA